MEEIFTSKTQTRLIAKRPCLVYFCGNLVVLASFTCYKLIPVYVAPGNVKTARDAGR